MLVSPESKQATKAGTMNSLKRICFVGPMLGTNPGWVPNPMEILGPYLEERGYTCLFTSRIVNRYRRLADNLVTLVAKRNEYDVISLQAYSGASLVVEEFVGRLAKLLGKPLIMVLHGGDLPRYIKKFPGLSRTSLRRASLVVTPSGYLAEAVKSLGIQAEIIPNIVSLENYTFRERSRLRPRMLWMRTFYDYYNPEMAVRVLAKILPDYPDAILTLAGQEKGTGARVRQYVSEAGLTEHVRFPGFIRQEEKQEIFDDHDIYLNTTFIDNMPVCLVEAGAFGLPIVSTDVGGVPFMVTHEDDALLVKPDDAGAMASEVLRLLRSPALARKLSANGRRMAERSDPKHVVSQWEGAFNSILVRE